LTADAPARADQADPPAQSAPGGVVGESIGAPGAASATGPASGQSSSTSADGPASATRESAAPREPTAAAWRDFAKNGDLLRAFAAADASGFQRACDVATSSELLALGDGARLAGRSDRAVEALLALRRRYPRDPRRAAAAFALGKVAFDQRRAYVEAAE